MPNTRLTFLIGRRAARQLWEKIRKRRPELLQKYQFLLAKVLLRCDIKQEELSTLMEDGKKDLNATFSSWWTGTQKEDVKKIGLMLVQLLGVNPDEIILGRPLSELPEEPGTRYEELRKDFAFKSPLFFNTGDNADLANFVLSQLWEDRLIKAEPGLKKLAAPSSALERFKFVVKDRFHNSEYVAEQFETLTKGYDSTPLDAIVRPLNYKEEDRAEMCELLSRRSIASLSTPSNLQLVPRTESLPSKSPASDKPTHDPNGAP